MRFSASAASAGVAMPSNSNSLRSAISTPSRDADQWTPRPAELDRDMIRSLLLLDFDLQQHELCRGQLALMLASDDAQLTGEHAFRKLRQVECRGIPTSATAELRGDRRRRRHPVPLEPGNRWRAALRLTSLPGDESCRAPAGDHRRC